MDATFNTNRSKLLLAIITGVTNTGSSFPAMQSFIKSESQLDWAFLLESAQQKLWKRPPKVIVADFGKGLAAALLVGQLITVVLQYCQWHAAKAIKKRIDEGIQTKAKRPYGYLAEERKVVKELFWPYLKLETVAELKIRASINIQYQYEAILILILNIEFLPSLRTNIKCEPCIIKALASTYAQNRRLTSKIATFYCPITFIHHIMLYY